jgi:DNA-directed RNA polymerase subunit RPC12/RpoP
MQPVSPANPPYFSMNSQITKEVEIYRNILNIVCLSLHGEKDMKGRTACPKCKHEFVLDAPDDSEKCEVVCPNCGDKFTIQPTSCDSKSEDECFWEEHGEPRKTILSAIKTRTNKPTIAAVLLISVFAIGITSVAFSDAFIETPLDVLANVGMTGSVDLLLLDQLNNSLGNVSIIIDGTSTTTDENGSYSAENISLGIKKVEVSLTGYKTLIREILVVPFITSSHEIIIEDGNGEKYIPFDTIGCSIVLVIFSVFALLAAVMSLKRQHFDVAVVGSILGIFSFGFLMIGSIISIIALIIILRSRDEFENGQKGKVF